GPLPAGGERESCIIGWKNHSPIFRASAEACSAAPRGGLTYHAKLRGVFGGGVDHLANFGDLGRREAADLGVLFDDRLVLGEIDAEGLVGRDIALDPLDVGAQIAQHAIRFRRGALQLLALQAADRRDIPLDDEFAQWHGWPPVIHVWTARVCPIREHRKSAAPLDRRRGGGSRSGTRSRGQAMASDPLPYARPRPGTQPPVL